MGPHLKYLRYVLRHKWYVFLAGLKLQVPIVALILHDWTKFLSIEWKPYVDYFYGDYPKLADIHGDMRNHITRTREDVKREFDAAWNHHQKANAHHWQYWLLTEDQPRKDWHVESPNMADQLLANGDYRVWVEPETQGRKATLFEAEQAIDKLCRTLNRMPAALPMPDRHMREMVADWMGAGRALGKPDTLAWYEKNKADIVLHPDTRRCVEELLNRYAR